MDTNGKFDATVAVGLHGQAIVVHDDGGKLRTVQQTFGGKLL